MYDGLIMNMTQTDNRKPARDKYHFDLKRGRYDGGEPKWLRNEFIHSAPYVIRKNMEITPATESISPKTTKNRAMTNVNTDAFIGSFVSPFPLDNNAFSRLKGNILSAANA